MANLWQRDWRCGAGVMFSFRVAVAMIVQLNIQHPATRWFLPAIPSNVQSLTSYYRALYYSYVDSRPSNFDYLTPEQLMGAVSCHPTYEGRIPRLMYS